MGLTRSWVTKRVATLIAVFTFAALVSAATPVAAKASFCGCSSGKSSAWVRNWDIRYMASTGGGNRLTIFGIKLIEEHPKHPFMAKDAEVDMYHATRMVKAHSLPWFKANVKKPSGATKKTKAHRIALKACLIAGYLTYLTDRIHNHDSVKKSLDDATWNCLTTVMGFYLARGDPDKKGTAEVAGGYARPQLVG